MITTFKITDQKAIKLAECDSVPKVMIILGQKGVGDSTLLYAVKQQSILENVEKNEHVIFLSPSGESDEMEYAHARVQGDESSTKITSALSRLEVAKRNIIAASSLNTPACQMFMSL